MNPPRKVRLLGKTWRVKRPKKLKEHGHCQHRKSRVAVARNQSKANERDTFLHEFAHAIDYELKLDIKETQVRRLATVLLSLLRDNPKLVRYLTR